MDPAERDHRAITRACESTIAQLTELDATNLFRDQPDIQAQDDLEQAMYTWWGFALGRRQPRERGGARTRHWAQEDSPPF